MSSSLDAEVRLEPQLRRTARKSISPRKPVIVSNRPASVNESIPTSKVVINTNEASSKDSTIHIEHESHQQQDDDDDVYQDNGLNTFDAGDDTDSDNEQRHQSVLKEERAMYRVKTQKLKLQMQHLQNDLDNHELEKEKLQLEIRLLELEVAEKERQKTLQRK